MIPVSQAIVVEGRYDKNRLSQIFDALIVPVNGFGIFKDVATLSLLRRLAVERGLIILTDSDGAGLIIRNFLRSVIAEGQVYHAYVGEYRGKEKRKAAPSKEGLLGVEGVPEEEIIHAVATCGAVREPVRETPERITTNDLYFLGLAGGKNSAEKRKKLLRRLGLPQNLSAGALCRYLSGLVSIEQIAEILKEL